MKKDRAKKIAEVLNETDIWHSHGHGISMPVLRSSRIKLQIEDFGKDKDLSQKIRDYWALLSDHMVKVGARGVIHTNGRYKHLARNLELIKELQKNGIDMGPNYNLESPFSRPNPHNGSSKPAGSTLYAEPLNKI